MGSGEGVFLGRKTSFEPPGCGEGTEGFNGKEDMSESWEQSAFPSITRREWKRGS